VHHAAFVDMSESLETLLCQQRHNGVAENTVPAISPYEIRQGPVQLWKDEDGLLSHPARSIHLQQLDYVIVPADRLQGLDFSCDIVRCGPHELQSVRVAAHCFHCSQDEPVSASANHRRTALKPVKIPPKRIVPIQAKLTTHSGHGQALSRYKGTLETRDEAPTARALATKTYQ
jgi:hypothetical protein